MHLSRLSLTNFRNFVRLEAEIPAGLTLVIGANAQGKTSLLEAIYYLAGATSPHATSDRQLINFLALREPTPVARIVAEVQRGGRPQRIEIRVILEPEAQAPGQRLRKEVLINGVKRRVGDLAGGFTAVMFLPQDMRTIEGPPGERRRHLDTVLSQADPGYARALGEYGKVLSQRNALLKQLQERNGDPHQLDFWDARLTDLAATLIRARTLALTELESLAAPIHHDLTQGREALQLEYRPAYDPAPAPNGQLGLPIDTPVDRASISREAIRAGMSSALKRARREEIGRGMTLIGPHRDDIGFRANGMDLRLYGSRGQNRTAVLAARLAEVSWLRRQTGEWPVLLLDEVLAELDPQRREDLLSHVRDAQQTILTSADLTMFSQDFRRRATIWQIRAGTLSDQTP
jgi:DNA replication and repair protein RecF